MSWVRTSDIEILSVDRYTYTFNQRIQLVYTNYLDAPNYGLRISFVQPDDAGQYECIINTRPETVQKVELFIFNGNIYFIRYVIVKLKRKICKQNLFSCSFLYYRRSEQREQD